MSQQDNKRADLKKRLAKERVELNLTVKERTKQRNNEVPNPSNTNPINNHLPTHTHHQAYQSSTTPKTAHVRKNNNTQPTIGHHQEKHSDKSQQTKQLKKREYHEETRNIKQTNKHTLHNSTKPQANIPHKNRKKVTNPKTKQAIQAQHAHTQTTRLIKQHPATATHTTPTHQTQSAAQKTTAEPSASTPKQQQKGN